MMGFKGVKRGMLYALASVTFALVMLSTSFLIFEMSKDKEANISRAAVFDRVIDLYTSIENGYRDAVTAAGIRIRVEGSKVIIDDSIPNENESQFQSVVAGWYTFLKQQHDFDVDINNSAINQTLPLTLYPTPTTYLHDSSLDGNTLEVKNASLVDSYSLEMWVETTENISLEWINKEEGSDLAFTVTVHTESSDTETASSTLDASETSELLINISNGDGLKIYIGDDSDNGRLYIENVGLYNVTTQTNITLDTSAKVIVKLPEKSVNITASEFNITKTSAPRLA